MSEKQLIKQMATWEQQRRQQNKGKAKDDKVPALASLTGPELEQAIKTGELAGGLEVAA